MVFSSFFFIDFREREKEGEREGEKHRWETETSVSCFLHVPQQGTKTTAKVYALTRNRTHTLLVCGAVRASLATAKR